MKFNSQSEFVNWFESECNRELGSSIGWKSPNQYYIAAKQICGRLNSKINVPSPYDGGWDGVHAFAMKILRNNCSLILSGYSSSSTSFTTSSGYTGPSNNTAWTNHDSRSTSTQTESGIVKRHNFDSSLRRIQLFSTQIPTPPELPKVETDGFWTTHKVTGQELNYRLEVIQNLFLKQNDHVIKTIQEFRDVYNTFDYLDREYLTGIVQAVNAATKASNGAKAASEQAKTASEQAKVAADKALKNESDLKKDVENLRKLVEKIKSIKEDFSNQILIIEASLNNSVKELKHDIELRSLSDKQQSAIKKFESTISRLKHFEDIDNLWNLAEIHEISIDKITKKLEKLEQELGSLSQGTPQHLKLDEKQNKKGLILAYAIGGLGLILSICSLVL